jgi:hypothetical protein
MTTQEKMNVIATVFGAKTGTKKHRCCTGKWKGTRDYSILFDNGEQLFIGNSISDKFERFVDETYEMYNPLTVREAKDYALEQLKKRAPQDNAIAEKLGFAPHEVLSVELITTDAGGYLGWYYIRLKVGDEIISHLETGLYYDIKGKKFSEKVKENYYTAGGLKDDEVDYIFNGVGFSTKSPIYKPRIEMFLYKALYTEVA